MELQSLCHLKPLEQASLHGLVIGPSSAHDHAITIKNTMNFIVYFKRTMLTTPMHITHFHKIVTNTTHHCAPPTFLPALPIWCKTLHCWLVTDVGSTNWPHLHFVELAYYKTGLTCCYSSTSSISTDTHVLHYKCDVSYPTLKLYNISLHLAAIWWCKCPHSRVLVMYSGCW